MFASYLSLNKEHVYKPLHEQLEDDDFPPPKSNEKSVWRHALLHALLVLEALQLILFLAAYSASKVIYSAPSHGSHDLDTYFLLSEYNTVKTFLGDWTKMNRSAESDALFEKIQESDGVVALDTQWALQHNLSPSVLHPEDASKSIYQIDMFHSMHCVYRLRNKLTSPLSLEEWPRNDEHTLHCLDYLREQLMCNSDITLEGTDDLLHFNKNSGHVCRNSDVVAAWAAEHHWDGHRKFLMETEGYH